MLNFEVFRQKANQVPCIIWSHAEFLYGLVKWLKPKTVVEVGSWYGGSAVWLARGLQENGNESRLYCIDDFGIHKDTTPTTVGNLYSNLCECGVEEITEILFGKSHEVQWPQKVDLAFIDGDHSYAVCQADVNKAIECGASCIIVHDTYSTYGPEPTRGPRQWLKKFRENPDWGMIEVPFDQGLAIAIKNPKEIY